MIDRKVDKILDQWINNNKQIEFDWNTKKIQFSKKKID